MNMTSEQAAAAAQIYIQAIESELDATAKVLAAVPQDRADYKPDPKSRSGFELAQHIALTDAWFLNSIAEGSFDFHKENRAASQVTSPAQAVEYYKREVPAALARVKAMTPEQLAKPVQFATFNFPNVIYLSFMEKHSIHHRGQLSAYLRAMGSKVPTIYGGSADEPFEMTQTAS